MIKGLLSLFFSLTVFGTSITPALAAGVHCAGGDTIDTAIGCVRIGNVNDTTAFFLQWAIGMSGGVGVILVLYAGILYIVSQGDPKKIQQAKSLFTSSITGVLMIVFSVFLLRVVGVDVLNIAGL